MVNSKLTYVISPASFPPEEVVLLSAVYVMYSRLMRGRYSGEKEKKEKKDKDKSKEPKEHKEKEYKDKDSKEYRDKK